MLEEMVDIEQMFGNATIHENTCSLRSSRIDDRSARREPQMSTLTAPAPRPLGLARAARQRPHQAAAPVVRVRWDRVGALLVALLLFLWLIGAGIAGRSQAEPAPLASIQVVVQSGDTLWDMARDHAPAGMATLESVMLVEQVNDVRAGGLIPGTVIELPQR